MYTVFEVSNQLGEKDSDILNWAHIALRTCSAGHTRDKLYPDSWARAVRPARCTNVSVLLPT